MVQGSDNPGDGDGDSGEGGPPDPLNPWAPRSRNTSEEGKVALEVLPDLRRQTSPLGDDEQPETLWPAWVWVLMGVAMAFVAGAILWTYAGATGLDFGVPPAATAPPAAAVPPAAGP